MPVSPVSIKQLDDLHKIQRRTFEGTCPSCNTWKKLAQTLNQTAAAVAILADSAAFLQFEQLGEAAKPRSSGWLTIQDLVSGRRRYETLSRFRRSRSRKRDLGPNARRNLPAVPVYPHMPSPRSCISNQTCVTIRHFASAISGRS
jgi:hypothetical protein